MTARFPSDSIRQVGVDFSDLLAAVKGGVAYPSALQGHDRRYDRGKPFADHMWITRLGAEVMWSIAVMPLSDFHDGHPELNVKCLDATELMKMLYVGRLKIRVVRSRSSRRAENM